MLNYNNMYDTPYTIVNLYQNTPKWLEWRSQGIGASDAPAIMGENPWKSADYLLKEKCNCIDSVSNAAMARGNALEPEARKSYERKFGIRVPAACLQSTKHEWMRASVDGLARDGSTVIEIKCGESVYRKSATTSQVPDYYFGQLQHILAVTGLNEIDFWCYLPNRPEVHIPVARDDGYIKRMLETEHAFWQRVLQHRKGRSHP
jgi:putative phage-type endonuclease